MLVLSRKLGQKVHIGNDISFTVLEVKGNRVRIGVEAPSDIQILRDELRTPFANHQIKDLLHCRGA
jgi:carbon storage regulator